MKVPLASAALLLFFLILPSPRAVASDALDSAALAELESRAEHAQAKEQAYLYTELMDNYVAVAGKQLAAGDMEDATTTLKRIQTYANRVHQGLAKDSKKLKNAEMLLHMATYHLTEMMHAFSSDDAAMLQATVKQLDKLHDELLAQVFAH